MNTETKTKICRDCKVSKPLEDYYKHRANTHYRICKRCANSNRKKYDVKSSYQPTGKRKNGFELMSYDQKKSIVDDQQTMSLKDIATKYGIKYTTLHTWKSKGVLVV